MTYEEITVGNEVVERCKTFPEIREPLQNSRPQKGDKKQLSEGTRILGATVLRHSSENLVLRTCANLKYCNFSILWTDIQVQNFENEQYNKA
jgi:hypothetical protein